jgi:hypothetical protein
MKQVLIFLLFILIQLAVSSQANIKIETGFFETELYNNESKDVAKKRAKQGAIINALEKAFGTAVFQGNSLFIKNKTTGQKVETMTGFNTIAETYVKGEVIEELNIEFSEISFEKRINNKKELGTIIKCEVKIKATEYSEPTANFDAFSLNCTDTTSCKTTSFKKNEDFFLYFKSPKNGYLSIFIDDNESSSLLFPYVSNREKYYDGYPIVQNKAYFLFTKEKQFNTDKLLVDELSWETRENLEKLTIIFSPNKFDLPDLKSKKSNSIPQSLPSVDFNKWLIQLRKKSKEIEIKKIVLNTIQE